MDKNFIDEVDNEKNDFLEELYSRKKRINNKINEYSDKLDNLLILLDITNEAICRLNGHSFTDWKDKLLDDSCYYERSCLVCGKKEISNDKSNEYSINNKMILVKKND